MKFSVLMSVYKNDKLECFKEALDSTIFQTKAPDEIVIVKDGPLNGALDAIIENYCKRYKIIKIVSIENNVGLGRALCIGLDNCSHEIVARMDSDDVNVKDRFEKQMNCFEEDKNLSIIGGYIDEFISDIHKPIGVRDVPLMDSEIKQYMKKRCPLNHVTVMFRKSEVLNAKGYQEWHFNEDYYLWIRMLETGCKFKNLEDVLVHVRVDDKMYGRRGGKKYYVSECNLQKYMYNANIINYKTYLQNVAIRFVVQMVLPNKLRKTIYSSLFRKKKN